MKICRQKWSLPESVVVRVFCCEAFVRFLSVALLVVANVVGRPNFLRWRILLTIVSLLRLATVEAIAATVVCDVVGIYVGRDLLRAYGLLELFRVVTDADDSVVSVISFDCVGFDFFCAVIGGRRNPGRNCGRTCGKIKYNYYRVFYLITEKVAEFSDPIYNLQLVQKNVIIFFRYFWLLNKEFRFCFVCVVFCVFFSS